jgi:hypothetical protein
MPTRQTQAQSQTHAELTACLLGLATGAALVLGLTCAILQSTRLLGW